MISFTLGPMLRWTQKASDIPTRIGYAHDQKPGVYVVCQRMPDDKGGLWQLDQITVRENGEVEAMRGNANIDYSYPVFIRPNFISDVLLTFGI